MAGLMPRDWRRSWKVISPSLSDEIAREQPDAEAGREDDESRQRQDDGQRKGDHLRSLPISISPALPMNREPTIQPIQSSSGGGRAAMVQSCGHAQPRHQSTE